MAVRVELDGAKGPPMEGVIAALDPTVDNITRTIKLRATLPSGGDTLRSGMFVDVRIVRPEKKTAVTVPATAVVHAPYGDSVFVVEDRKQDAPGPSTTQDGKPIKNARQQFVKIGESRGDFVTILDGVKAGQEIVAIGAFKLRNNAPVFVGDVAGPKPALDPKPQNR
jgi:membrane fusion protein (multidrug efflux system)